MALTIDGNSLVFEGTVTITNFTNPTNGVCTLMLTPSGGVGNLPALVNGDPGLPPTLTVGTVTTLSAGQQATFVLNQTSAGGAGAASAYTVNVGLPQGAAGDTGDSGDIGAAPDLSGTAAVGDIITVSSVTSGTPAFEYMAFPWGFVINATSLSNLSESGNTSGQIGSISIAGQPFNWVPLIFAQSTVAGTANTVVSLQAFLNTVNTGNVLGEVDGFAGTATQILTMIPSFGGLVGQAGYGEVSSGATSEVFLTAKQSAGVSDSWATSNSKFTVVGVAVSS